jgi:uncharacterized repeat protein (TIGR04052 family)
MRLSPWFLAAAAFVSACGDEEDPPAADKNYSVKFSAVVGDEPFACGQSYAGIGTTGATITPLDLRFYVHDVKLVREDGEEVALKLATNDYQYKNVAMLDFEDASGDCDQGDAATYDTVTGTAPEASYRGVSFSLGVPADMNHVALDSQPAPLNKTALFWGWKLGHIYFAGVSRAMVASSTVSNDHYTHVGSTGCVGDPENGMPVTSCAKANRRIYTLNGNVDNVPVVVDFKALKANADVTDGIGCHSFDAASCSGMFDSLGLDFSTGAAGDAQTVFLMR